jgi:hypothetical protein
MPGKFVMEKSGNGYHWNLLATNGKVIATQRALRNAPSSRRRHHLGEEERPRRHDRRRR